MSHSSSAFALLLLGLALSACKTSGPDGRPDASTPGSDGGSSPDSGVAGDCTLVPPPGWGPSGTIPIRTEVVARGLEVPWALAWLPDGTLLVTERAGRVRQIAEDGTLVTEPVARLPLVATGEGGLLGLAVAPDFRTSRRFFLYVTTAEGGRSRNRVERWIWPKGKAARLDRVILDDIPSARFHDGGRLRFGPDGLLYVATGDAGQPTSSRDPQSPSGKLLRITEDGAPAPGNPGEQSAVYLRGLRNLQAFDWLGEGRLVVADHGPSGELGRRAHDEVSVVRAGDDLGWPAQDACTPVAGTVLPVLSFETAAPPGGLARYTGKTIAAWKGSVLVAALGSRNLLRLELTDDGRLVRHEVYLQDAHGRLRDANMGPDGHLYLTTSNCDGRGQCGPEKDVILRVLPR